MDICQGFEGCIPAEPVAVFEAGERFKSFSVKIPAQEEN